MSANVHIDNIQKYLQQHCHLLRLSNKSGLTNSSILAEDLYRRILNIIFGWNLTNSNARKANQKAYDLSDESNQIYVQVTAQQNHKSKFNTTIKSFLQIQEISGGQLIILFISENIDDTLKSSKQENGITYCGADIGWLLKEIVHLDVLKLEEIDKILQCELNPVLINYPSDAEQEEVTEQPVKVYTKGLYLRRQQLEEELFQFSQLDNGLLTGGAGYGKSMLLNDLQKCYYEKGLPCYVVRINELVIGDKGEIAEALELGHDWLGKLSKIETQNSGKGLIIFDAFDTAKEERLKSMVFKQIRSAISTLGNNWNVLVSTRTYDAEKSTTLQDMFPYNKPNSAIKCRYFEVPAFSNGELKEIFLRHPELSKASQKCTTKLRASLKVPYFLGIFEQVIHFSKEAPGELTGIETESQLLEYYWSRSVNTNTKQQLFLQKLTQALIIAPSMVTDSKRLLNEHNAEAFEELLLHNIIVLSGVQQRYLGFTHNILLEFAICKFILCEDKQEQITLIETNEKLPFLFMQSFLYFYNDLWREDPRLFYDHYFALKNINKPVFRLFHQTILNYVLISSYTQPEQLQPLLNEPDKDKRAEIIRKALEALRFVHKNVLRCQDIEFLLLVSSQLNPILIWEVGYSIETGLAQESFKADSAIQGKLAQAANNFMEYVLSERKRTTNKQFIDANAGHWGIRNLTRTFGINIEDSKRLINDVLELLKEEDFPLNYIHTLSEGIDNIFSIDADFGSHVYKTIYLHTETSEKATNLGGGVVLNLRSNRKQDYAGNYYSLEKKFPQLLKIDFFKALELGAQIVNRVSEKRSYAGENLRHRITLEGKVCWLAQNKAYYEDDEQHGPFVHGRAIFEFLMANTPTPSGAGLWQSWLEAVVVSIEASSLWRKFLKMLTAESQFSLTIAYNLLTNKVFFECDETLYEATELLNVIWRDLSNEQRLTIEKQLWTLKHPEPIFHNEKWKTLRLKKIFSVLPADTLDMKESQDFIAKHGTTQNEKIIKSGVAIAKNYVRSAEERFIEAGFDNSNETEKNQFSLYDEVESFNQLFYNNKKPKVNKKLYSTPFSAAVRLFELAKSGSFGNQQKQFTCDYALSTFASTLSAHIPRLSSHEISFLKAVGFHYINDANYIGSAYEEGHLSDRTAGSYSSNARTAAIHVLKNILYDTDDAEAKLIVLKCMSDNLKIVRFKALKALPYYWEHDRGVFWEVIKDRSVRESDALCMSELISSLCYDSVIDNDNKTIHDSSIIILNRLRNHDTEANREVWKVFVVLLLIRILRHDVDEAHETIKTGLGIKEFCRNLCFEIRTSLNALNGKPDFLPSLELATPYFRVLDDILKHRFNSLKINGLNSDSAQQDFEIIDHVIQNIYFTVHYERGNNEAQLLTMDERTALFAKFVPLLDFVAHESSMLESGFMVAHTGYYFMKILNVLVDVNPEKALCLSTVVVQCGAKNGFTYDRSTLPEIVKLTEKLIVDHKLILEKVENFKNIIVILDQFEQSGSQEALQLAWSLRELF